MIKRKLPNNLLWSMHDVKNVVYRLINDEGIREAETLAGGMKKFAWEVELKAGMITFTNAAALAIK